jgi:hypothetical protein
MPTIIKVVVTTHPLACADVGNATPDCSRRIANRPATLGVFVALAIGNLLPQEEEGHCQRVDHHSGHHRYRDRDDPGGAARTRDDCGGTNHQYRPARLSAPGDQTLASPDSSCTSTTGGSNRRPTDYESASATKLAAQVNVSLIQSRALNAL